MIKTKQVLLLFGDILLLFLSLGLMLLLRYGWLFYAAPLKQHLLPFSIIFAIWILGFYIVGLYELRSLKNSPEFYKKLGLALFVCVFSGITFFYLIPIFGIAPKTNLFIFLLVFGLLIYLWRSGYNSILGAKSPINRILLIGSNSDIQELVQQINAHPQLNYEIKFWMKQGFQDKEFRYLAKIISDNNINLIVMPAHIQENLEASRLIYKNILLGIEVQTLADLYENIFQKVLISDFKEAELLEKIGKKYKDFEKIKRPLEIILTLCLIPILLPIMLFIAAAIKLNSMGPIIYKQLRVGKSGKEYIHYKFRSMRIDAEKDGPRWAGEKDQRTTLIGKILRKAHLDELPQLLNILGGDMSLVGPRPERPEFTAQLKEKIPHYALRHLIRPGITGWAQINYRYGASIEDARQKLQYDLYYLKNQSLVLDVLILIKTIKYFFTSKR